MQPSSCVGGCAFPTLEGNASLQPHTVVYSARHFDPTPFQTMMPSVIPFALVATPQLPIQPQDGRSPFI